MWQWFGGQGFEYLDLGRFWQALLTVGLFFWVIIIFRGLRGRLRTEHLANMPWLFFFSALSIPIFYGVGLLASPGSHSPAPSRPRSRVGGSSCPSSVQTNARCRFQIPSPSRCLGVSDWTTTKAHRYRLYAASGSVSSASAHLQCLLDQASLHGIRTGPRDRA